MVETITQLGPVPTVSRPLRAANKTLAFDGTSGNGAVGTATVFALSGRVHVVAIRAFCTETLVGASATLSLGVSSNVDAIIAVTTATNMAANDFWIDSSPAEIGYVDLPTAMIDFLCSEDIDVDVLTQAITDGTIRFEVDYLPLTDDGILVGD